MSLPRKIVVLDDDPTGTQTVHGVPVLTGWSVGSLAAELENDLPAFYVLTNTRALPLEAAEALCEEVGRNLAEAGRRAGRDFAVVSRGDSTLRGHFPGEVAALERGLGGGFDAWLLAPYFEAGGRVTVGDVHYLREDDRLVPVNETEFARDPDFGFSSSNLREWVEEKTGGRVAASSVASVSLEDIRGGGPDRVTAQLLALPRGAVCVVNLERPDDLETFMAGLFTAEDQGRRYLYRTAASFAAARAGLGPRLLERAEFGPPAGGALIVVGSHVGRTGAQLERLLALSSVRGVEVGVERLLEPSSRALEIERIAREADAALERGQHVAIYTSRRLVGRDGAGSLNVGAQISSGLVEIVRAIRTRPRLLVAKGGITSSDLATKALGVRRALVLGQAAPGVPVWRLGPESRWPGLAYVVFPGNVGGPDALATLVSGLS